MNRQEWGDTLALVNACLNFTSAVFLISGRIAIAQKNRDRHRRCMVAAFFTSSVFLASYLTRVALTGTHRDPHTGIVHVIYLAVLISHMILAVAVVPLVFVALYEARKERWAQHRSVVRYTFPIWTYVSVTGVVVYLLLYCVPA